MASRFYFRLLGPLEVIVGDHPLELGAPRQRAIMAMLLLEANHVVPVNRLVDAVWDDDPPVTARSQIQMCVSALRRLLDDRSGVPVIMTRPSGYMLRVPDDALDVRQFEMLAARGRAAAAAGRSADAVVDLRAALGLWLGVAADGIESRIVRMAAVRLDEHRLAALGDCLELELELGRHHEVVGELQGKVAEFPLNERLRTLQMLALYRAGRQADALRTFRDARNLLLEELGLDPGDEMRAMEQAILENDPSLARARPPADGRQVIPRQLPATLGDFTGRDDILRQICSLLIPADDSAHVHMPVITLSGRGGVGKTTVALHAAHFASKAFPDGQLYAQLHGGNAQEPSIASVLEGFLRSLGVAPSAIADSLDEKVRTYRSWLAGRRVLVVLDDVGSVGMVPPLMPGSATCAVIITSRSRMSCPPGGRQFEIPVFDEDTGLKLLASVLGADRVDLENSAARQLVRQCDRLPLALRIISAKLAARPHWPIRQMVSRLEDEKRRLDELNLDDLSVRKTIAFAYDGLSEQEKRLLARLCLLGSESFASWVSAPLLNMDADAATDVLENLVAARLVGAWMADNGSVRYQLHDLVRLLAAEHLARDEPQPAREMAVERLLGCWLFLVGEAHRRNCGGDFSLLHGTAPLWRLPSYVVDDLLADPIVWLQRERSALVAAIHQAARSGLDELCWDLATASVTLFEVGAYAEDWQATHTAALDAARQAGNRRGEAAVLYSLATLSLTKRPAEAARQLEAAFDIFTELDDIHGQGLALGNQAFVERLKGAADEAAARYQRALSLYRQSGDLIGEIDMLRGMAKIKLIRDQDDAAEELLAEAERISRRVPHRRVKAQTSYELGELYLKRGDLQRAEKSFEDTLRFARAADDLVGQAYALLGTGTVHYARGDYQSSGEKLEAALESSRETAHLLIQSQILLMLTEVDLRRDDPRRAGTWLRAAQEILSDLGADSALHTRAGELHVRVLDAGGLPTGQNRLCSSWVSYDFTGIAGASSHQIGASPLEIIVTSQ